jgi:hypothetical protein
MARHELTDRGQALARPRRVGGDAELLDDADPSVIVDHEQSR